MSYPYSAPINLVRYSNGTLVKLTASAHEFIAYEYYESTKTGVYYPETITITARYDGNVSFGKWQYSLDGINWQDVANIDGIAASESALAIAAVCSLFGESNSSVTFKLIGSDNNHYDTVTITRTIDPILVYSHAQTAIEQTNRRIALIASDEELKQFTTAQTLVTKVSQIEETADGIVLTVSRDYATKAYAEATATEKANAAGSAAEAAANDATDAKLSAYSTTAQMRSEIQQTADAINLSVSSTYATTTLAQGYADAAYNRASADISQAAADAADDATSKAKQALADANAATDQKLANYSTTAQMNSAIQQTADAINLSVSATYATIVQAQGYADAAEAAANDATDAKLSAYSTTAQMNSAIQQSADSIMLSVQETIGDGTGSAINLIADCKAVVGWVNNAGELVDYTNYRSTDYLSVTPGEKFVFQIWNPDNVNTWTGYTTFDENKGIVEYHGKYSTDSVIVWEISIPDSGVSFLRVSYLINRKVKLERGSVATEWSQAPEDIESNISALQVTASNISSTVSTKVGNDEIISKINQSAESVQIQASKINLAGYVTFTNLSTSGSTTINADNLTTGKITAVDIDGVNISGSIISFKDATFEYAGQDWYNYAPSTGEGSASIWMMGDIAKFHTTTGVIGVGVENAGRVKIYTDDGVSYINVDMREITVHTVDMILLEAGGSYLRIDKNGVLAHSASGTSRYLV